MRAVADEIATAVDAGDAELVDARQRGLQRRQVGVDVGDDGHLVHDSGHASIVSIDNCRLNRYLYIDVDRSGARPQAEARSRWAVLRARRLSRRRARAGAAD